VLTGKIQHCWFNLHENASEWGNINMVVRSRRPNISDSSVKGHSWDVGAFGKQGRESWVVQVSWIGKSVSARPVGELSKNFQLAWS